MENNNIEDSYWVVFDEFQENSIVTTLFVNDKPNIRQYSAGMDIIPAFKYEPGNLKRLEIMYCKNGKKLKTIYCDSEGNYETKNYDNYK